MQPRIENVIAKKLVGMSEKMSLIENKTFKLFRTFMPRKREIKHSIDTLIYDVRVYPDDYYINFDPAKLFTKWALVEVSSVDQIPESMEVFQFESGDYAVFTENPKVKGEQLFEYVYTKWLPGSNYELDNRPHFDILTEKHQKQDPTAKMELWIPIQVK